MIKVTTENSYTFQLTAYSYNSQDLGVELNYIQVTNKKSLKLRLSLIEVASKFKMVNLQLSVVISLVYTWVVVSFAIFKHSQNIFVTFTAAFKYKLLLTIAIYAPIWCVKVTNVRCKSMIWMQLSSYSFELGAVAQW